MRTAVSIAFSVLVSVVLVLGAAIAGAHVLIPVGKQLVHAMALLGGAK